MFGNIYPTNVVNIGNGPHFVFLRDLAVKNGNFRFFVHTLYLMKLLCIVGEKYETIYVEN